MTVGVANSSARAAGHHPRIPQMSPIFLRGRGEVRSPQRRMQKWNLVPSPQTESRRKWCAETPRRVYAVAWLGAKVEFLAEMMTP